MALACPRCGQTLQEAFGDLGEHVCPGCAGRLLPPELTQRVLLDEGGLDAERVKAAALASPDEKLRCPTCRAPMSTATLQNVPVDLCFECGATFLDAGELMKVSRGLHIERRVRRAPQQDDAPGDGALEAPPDPRATWEKALPLTLIEASVAFFVLERLGVGGTPGTALAIAFSAAAAVIALSMLVDVDMRSLWQPRRRWGWGLHGHRHHGLGGVVLLLVGVVVAGGFTTLNAMIAERFPRATGWWPALVAVGGACAVALMLHVKVG